MQIIQQPIVDVLCAKDVRYVIPVFQRVYSWTARQCEELWDDIVRAGRTGEPHFMGLLLFSRDPDAHDALEQVNVIDGQQRMTTMMLLLTALQFEELAPAPLALSSMDRATLDALVAGDDLPEEPAERLIDNYMLFVNKIAESGIDEKVLHAGLDRLEVATVMLGTQDSPQLVFESLNSKGMALSTADRVRNYIVASTEGENQERLYSEFWLPLEDKVAASGLPVTVSDVLHAWLVQQFRSVRIVDPGEVYGLFKTRLRDEFDGSLENALSDVAVLCDRYLSDEEFRTETQADAEAWIAGKPKDSVSEYKLFGD